MPRQLLLVLAIFTAAAQTKPTALVERVKDTGFIQLQAPSFERLTPREKALTYWLTQAAIAIDPIIYDQQSAYGLRQKRVLEGIVSHPKGIPAPVFGKDTARGHIWMFAAGRAAANYYILFFSSRYPRRGGGSAE